ncbi:hypothetical protein SISNIDRAFT_489251 [Sistotremastrum niveocremeum HHB9708]|uniref:Uncharacterized protein n=1 Tax=Sistotremastrum niveocremeum HHB9708 TaxID=1314777 RepID=A0A164QDU8_9AGAM|nr:hypothetical protein SISNIDRAFT_489251 [Sistotremastrum niveocremeum HHB9708]
MAPKTFPSVSDGDKPCHHPDVVRIGIASGGLSGPDKACYEAYVRSDIRDDAQAQMGVRPTQPRWTLPSIEERRKAVADGVEHILANHHYIERYGDALVVTFIALPDTIQDRNLNFGDPPVFHPDHDIDIRILGPTWDPSFPAPQKRVVSLMASIFKNEIALPWALTRSLRRSNVPYLAETYDKLRSDLVHPDYKAPKFFMTPLTALFPEFAASGNAVGPLDHGLENLGELDEESEATITSLIEGLAGSQISAVSSVTSRTVSSPSRSTQSARPPPSSIGFGRPLVVRQNVAASKGKGKGKEVQLEIPVSPSKTRTPSETAARNRGIQDGLRLAEQLRDGEKEWDWDAVNMVVQNDSRIEAKLTQLQVSRALVLERTVLFIALGILHKDGSNAYSFSNYKEDKLPTGVTRFKRLEMPDWGLLRGPGLTLVNHLLH